MSGHTAFGAVILATALSGILKLAGIATEPPVGIDVESLSFETSTGVPYIHQQRTVTAGSALTARWAAAVSVLDGTKLVEICAGSGYWDYEVGYKNAEILFDEWVGQAGCYDLIPHGAAFVLEAEYKWGDSGLEREQSAPIIKP